MDDFSDIQSMPFAYKRGNNPYDDQSFYECFECGLVLFAAEVGYVPAGPQYANGEYAKCPLCGEENQVYRPE